jgi:ABC-type uncharacterized transport system substrate-binding protein
MRKRELILLFGLAAALSMPWQALAQEPGRIYRIGGLHSAPRDAPHHLAFMDELRRLGFIEGQNLVVDWRGYGQPVEKFDEIAGDLVKARVDVILVGGDAATRAAQQATKTIPILGITDDMVGKKFVRSLAKPEGNVTGVSLLAPDLDGKRQDILTEAVPGLRRMAALADLNTTTQSHLQSLQDAARERGVELAIHGVSRAEDIVPAIEAAKASGAAGLNVLASALLFNNRQIILARTAALRLPAVYQWPEIAEEGGLVAYGPRIVQLYRDVMTRQFVKLLNGTKLTDVPVEQPTHFELVINLKAAKQIGHEVPAGLVLRADKVIE